MRRVGISLVLVWGCSSSSETAAPVDGGTDGSVLLDAGGGDGGPSLALRSACKDSLESIYTDPGPLAAVPKGEVLRCAEDKGLVKDELEALAKAGVGGYAGKAFTSGAKVFRVLYRTERGDAANTPGTSSALVFLPENPRGKDLPVVVASHGSRGQAARCAPSKNDPAAANTWPDFIHQVYPLVGLGYAVIAPDLAGYANYGAPGNPPSAYGHAADAGKSTLDGARALRKMVSGFSDKVVLVGHSQGGGTALAALAMAESYGADGTVAAAAVYAPLWLPARAYAALFRVPNDFPLATSAAPKVSIWYHYTHSELLDGPGHGVDLFRADKKAAIKQFVDESCWKGDYPELNGLGQSANDLFEPSYVQAISFAAVGLGDCNGNELCQTWMDRFAADRPHLVGPAAKVPLAVLYGPGDTTISPPFMRCVFDRLQADQANLQSCVVPGLGHSDIVSTRADWVSDWIASKTLGTPEPPACPADATGLTDDAGAPIACSSLVQNE